MNSVAADSSGQAYYADRSIVPHVTDEHAARCNTALGRATFELLRLPVLDGSRSSCEWGSDPDAVQDGIFGPGNLPSLFRSDYVTNSNDSYWLANPEAPLEGFDRIIGDEETARSLRTRLGLVMVRERLAGSDGRPGKRFTLRQLQKPFQQPPARGRAVPRRAGGDVRAEPDDRHLERAGGRERGLPRAR